MENSLTRVTFTRERHLRLKKRYEKAVAAEESEFNFEGNDYLTDYAKYLLEYLETLH